MNIHAHAPSTAGEGPLLSIRCPVCRQLGTFETLEGKDIKLALVDGVAVYAGNRRCPNPKCHAYVFMLHTWKSVLASYPPERIDFDASNIPSGVAQALEEAITCHANGCYVAAAIMVRKTLEELCRDRGATGGNLKDRIRALGSKVVIPQELLDGLDDLRLLGNDAAHFESQAYDKVGREEVEVGLEFAKEVLKAVYQYSDLLNRLRGLKKAAASQP